LPGGSGKHLHLLSERVSAKPTNTGHRLPGTQ
jgi:hypothetical protein